MKYRELRQTVFQVEPLKNIVGIGDTAAFQIIVSPGPSLGSVGTVVIPAHAEICNEPRFAPFSAEESAGTLLTSWFRRALATLNS